jgi:hypothetical protein
MPGIDERTSLNRFSVLQNVVVVNLPVAMPEKRSGRPRRRSTRPVVFFGRCAHDAWRIFALAPDPINRMEHSRPGAKSYCGHGVSLCFYSSWTSGQPLFLFISPTGNRVKKQKQRLTLGKNKG